MKRATNGTESIVEVSGSSATKTSKPSRLKVFYDKHWLFLGSATILLGFVLAVALLFALPVKLPAVGAGALIVLFFTAVGFNMMSSEEDMTNAEVQHAITFAVLYVFFALFAVSESIVIPAPTANAAVSILPQLLEHFWIVVLSVVGFYFGGRIVEHVRTPAKTAAENLVDDALWEVQKRVRRGDADVDVVAEVQRLQKALPLPQQSFSRKPPKIQG
ncbi:MAG TPA: hypothetical protein VGB18_05400 [Candidatus Thermoplasmatota archaeon]